MKKMLASIVVLAVCILFGSPGITRVQAADEAPWARYAVTYGKGMILTSPDSENWTMRVTGSDVPLVALTYGKETFVAVGNRGTIVTGPKTGSKWTIRKSDVTSDLWAVTFEQGIFVAVGSAGTVTTSPDGITWTKRANLTTNALRDIDYGKNNFVTIGEAGNIFNSQDGIYWARHPSQYTDNLLGMTYAKGTFVVVGGNGKILTSSDDGKTWTERYSGTSEYLTAVTYGNEKGVEKFVAVGAYGTIITSPDGMNWTTVKSGSITWLGAVAQAGKKFIAVGNDGTILTSPDGTNWSLSRYGEIAAIAPEPMAKAKVEEPAVVLASEPVVEKQAVLAQSEPPAEEQMKAAAVEPQVIILAFEDIHFNFDKSTLTPAAQTILKRNIQLLKDNPKAKIRIAGYTSASGTEAYNQELSERRATAVQEYLINEGVITQDRLATIGYGKTNPAVYEASPKVINSKAARANMRVLSEVIMP